MKKHFVFMALLAALAGFAQSKPLKIVLFNTEDYGAGHKAASEAIAAEIHAKDPTAEVVIINLSEYTRAPVRALDGLYRRALREGFDKGTKYLPEAYDGAFTDYQNQGARIKDLGDMPISKNLDWDAIEARIRRENPDLMGSTWSGGTEALIKIRSRNPRIGRIPFFWQHTDYIDELYFARLADDPRVDMSFAPARAITDAWLKRGVAAAKLLTGGIPVNLARLKPLSLLQKARIRKLNGLKLRVPVVVIAGGLNGVGDYAKMVGDLGRKINFPLQVFAVTGLNHENAAKLEELRPTLPKNISLTVHDGLMDNAALMNLAKASNVYATKPGGVALTEAVYGYLRTIAHTKTPAQERYNRRFFADQGLAIVTQDDYSQFGDDVLRMLVNDQAGADMLANQKNFVNAIANSSDSEGTTRADWILKTAREGRPPVIPARLAREPTPVFEIPHTVTGCFVGFIKTVAP